MNFDEMMKSSEPKTPVVKSSTSAFDNMMNPWIDNNETNSTTVPKIKVKIAAEK